MKEPMYQTCDGCPKRDGCVVPCYSIEALLPKDADGEDHAVSLERVKHLRLKRRVPAPPPLSMSQRERAILALYGLPEWCSAQIAEALGESPEAVRQVVSRLKKRYVHTVGHTG